MSSVAFVRRVMYISKIVVGLGTSHNEELTNATQPNVLPHTNSKMPAMYWVMPKIGRTAQSQFLCCHRLI